MNFVTNLRRTFRGHDMIWVVADRLTKSAHFLAQVYIKEILRLHGLSSSIVSNRDLVHFSILVDSTECFG